VTVRAHLVAASTAASAFVASMMFASALLGLAATASASPLPPVDVRVEGGEDAWHAKRSFSVIWANPDPIGGPPIAAVHYRLRNPAGTVAIAATRIDWPAVSIDWLMVPGPPGAYTVEIWLEDAAGEVGPPADAKLRFDDRRPGGVVPFVAGSWVGRTAFPLSIRLTHPSGEPPVSGIRGYAVSVAATPNRSPCETPDRCTEAETDLRGGTEEDSYSVADLPEGTNYVQAVAVSGSGMASETAGRTVVRVDETSPLTTLRGAPSGWTNRPVRLTATAVDDGSGMLPGGGFLPYTAIAIDGSFPTTAAGDSVSATVIGEGVHRISYYARDLAGNVDDGGDSNGTSNPPPPTALVRIDRKPPTASFVNALDPIDPELIRARIVDSMSGPAPARGWIGIRRSGSGDPYMPLPAAPAPEGELRARWDSDAYVAGEYELRAIGYDVAGNATVSTRRANGTTMVLSNPLKATTVLQAGLGAKVAADDSTVRAPSRIVPFGHRTLLRGRLAGGTGGALPGMPVRIVERFAAETGLPARVSTVTTGSGGAFAIRLAAGPSREVAAIFDGTATLSRSASPNVRLGVRSRVKFGASSKVATIGGPPLVFRGRVGATSAVMPPVGKSVQLQFRLPGLPWSEFRTIQTDRHGRFRYAYRFRDDDSRGVRFQFRAYAPAQDKWPYEPGGSRPLTVRGR